MPKIKTNRSAYKKLKVTKSKKIKRGQAYMSHNTAKKSPGRKRRLVKMVKLDRTNLKTARKLLPNSF